MASAPNSVTVRKDLTEYAHGLMQDFEAARRLMEILAPTVPTGATSGQFNKFETTQAFKKYAAIAARRAIGGKANIIELLGEATSFNALPYGLRVSIDEYEREQATERGTALLEQAKTRTLTINSLVAHLGYIVTVIKAAVSAEAGKGDWANPNVDPIAELNGLIKAVYLASGKIPNTIAMDFGAWCVFSSNANILARMPGADLAMVNPERAAKLLVNPSARIELVETAVLTGGGLANTDATVEGILGGSVLAFYNTPMATVYDPSFCKTFSPSATLFTEVRTYREEPQLDWYQNDWTADVQVVSSMLCKRIDVTGANS